MLKLVLKVRLQALLNSMFRFGESSRKSRIPKAFKITLLAILFAYVFVAVGFSIGIMFHSLGEVFIPVGLDWAYFVLVGLLALILGFVGSVFVTKTELFEARDNELLLSMPIRPVYILAGRILMLWMVELAYSLIIFVPTGIVYFIFSKANILSITAYLISCIAMSFLTLTLSCFFGWVFAMITRNMARKNLFTTVVMFVFFGLYIYAYANMSALITSIVEKGAALAEAIKKVLPPIYFFAKGASGDIIGLLLFLLCSLLPFAFVVWILSATFSKIVTKRTGLKAKSYSGGGLAVSDVRKALVKKELNRFFSLPIYLFNSGLGVIMMIVFSLLVLVKGGELIAMLSQIPEFADYIPIGCALVICFCASLSATTAPSLSLEGKAFSQLKSMPIGAKDIYAAKIAANLIITMPGVIVSGSITQFVCEMDVLSRLTLFLLPASVQLFTAVFGMLCNVWFPRFEWVNETMVVKQSVSVLISILGGLAVLLLPCALYIGIFFGFISATVFALAFAALMVIVSAFIWHLLCTRGAKKYLAMT